MQKSAMDRIKVRLVRAWKRFEVTNGTPYAANAMMWLTAWDAIYNARKRECIQSGFTQIFFLSEGGLISC